MPHIGAALWPWSAGGNPLAALNPSVWFEARRFDAAFTDTGGTTPVPGAGNAVARADNLGTVSGFTVTQATSTKRPVLTARVNLLLASEALSNAAWTRTDVTPTDSAATAPGGFPATLMTEGSAATATCNQAVTAVVSGATYVYRKIFLRGNHDWVLMGVGDNLFTSGVRQWVNLATGALGTRNTFGTATGVDATITSLGNGWYAVTLTVSGISSTTLRPYTHSASANAVTTRVANGTRYEAASDFRSTTEASNLPAYQRVGTTAADIDTVGFPWYWSWDGTDDCLFSAANLNLTATDKITVLAAFRQANDTATFQTLCETSASTGAGVNSIFIGGPDSGGATRTQIAVGGTTIATRNMNRAASPANLVLSAAIDRSQTGRANQMSIRFNGSAATEASGADSALPGNFSNTPLFIGQRNNASLPFNGRVYGLAIIPRLLTAAELVQAETYMNGLCGAY